MRPLNARAVCSQRSGVCVLWWVVACAVIVCPARLLAEQIEVPFGLKWGLSKKKFERLIEQQSVKVVEKRPVEAREAWTLEGFVQENLMRVLVYFDQRGRMNEIELQYQRKGWSPEKYEGHVNFFKRNFESKYGAGRVITRSTKKEGAATIRMEAYEWRSAEVILRLFYFGARRKAESYNNISVHYRSSL